MKKLLAKLLIVAGLVLGGVAFTAVPATAAPATPAAAAEVTSHDKSFVCFCADAGPKFDPEKFQKYLSAERWRDATGTFHGRFDQFLQNDFIAMTQRSLTEGIWLSTGNMLYSTSEGFLGFSMEMQPIQVAGAAIDNASSTIAGALFGSSGAGISIVLVVVVGIIIMAFFQMRRGIMPWKRLGGVTIVIALLSLMMAGAAASTTDANGQYKPGFGSPGWFATSINTVVSQVANAPVSGMLALRNGSSSVAPDGSGCAPYMKNLSATYLAGAGSTASVSSILSGMWEDSGLTIWKEVQYGTTDIAGTNRTYGDDVFCHQLDWNASISPADQAKVTFGTIPTNFNKSSYAWGPPAGAIDNDVQDKSLIAWAACDLKMDDQGAVTATVKKGWDKKINSGDCTKWWDGDQSLDAFNVGGAADQANQWDDPAIVDFIHALHGNDYMTSGTLTIVYALSALGVFVVFCGFAVAIAIAKFAGLVMMVAVMFVLVAQLLTNQQGTGKLVPFLKSYVGFSVIAFGANFILALIAMMSRVFGDMGNKIFSPGSEMALVWNGFAPLLAVIVLHLVLTKVLKMPSVFTPSSAMAWGQSGGGIGNAANVFSRVTRGAGRMAGRVGRRGLGKGRDLLLNGRNSRPGRGRDGGRGGMNPLGAGGARGLGASGEPTAKDIKRNARSAAEIAGMTNKQIRKSGLSLDKRVVRDARWFARGVDPSTIPTTGYGRYKHARSYWTQQTGKGIATGFHSTVDGARKGLLGARAMADAVKSGEAKQRAGEYAKAVGSASKNAWGQMGAAATYFREQPIDATRRALDVSHKAFITAENATEKFFANDTTQRVMRAALPTAAGLVLAGPAGAAAGAAIGARAQGRYHNRTKTRRDAERVLAYQASLPSPKSKDKNAEPQPQPVA